MRSPPNVYILNGYSRTYRSAMTRGVNPYGTEGTRPPIFRLEGTPMTMSPNN
jgi:hypothetical protein